MKDNLKKVRQKDFENKFGQMVLLILVNLNKNIEMDLENIFTPMDIMKENLSKIAEKEMDRSFLMMGQYLKANGIKVICMEKSNLLIKMEM